MTFAPTPRPQDFTFKKEPAMTPTPMTPQKEARPGSASGDWKELNNAAFAGRLMQYPSRQSEPDGCQYIEMDTAVRDEIASRLLRSLPPQPTGDVEGLVIELRQIAKQPWDMSVEGITAHILTANNAADALEAANSRTPALAQDREIELLRKLEAAANRAVAAESRVAELEKKLGGSGER